MTFQLQKITSGLILSSFLFQFSAMASNPVRFSQLTLSTSAVRTLERMVEKRAEHFMTLGLTKQVKILDRADRRYDHLIARISKWTDEKFQNRVRMAENLASAFSNGDETEKELSAVEQKDIPLTSDERIFYGAETSTARAAPIAEITPASTANGISRIELLNQLKQSQQSIRTLKSDLLLQAKNEVGAYRKIAASTAVKAVLTALFAILIVAGIFAIVFGVTITVATLGLLAPLGIFWVTIGAVLITGGIIGIPLFWTKM